MTLTFITIEADSEELRNCRSLSEGLISALNRAFSRVATQEAAQEEEDDDNDNGE